MPGSKTILANSAACMSEAIMISLVNDKEIQETERKDALKVAMDKVTAYSDEFGCDLRRMVQARVMSEAVNKLLAGTRVIKSGKP